MRGYGASESSDPHCVGPVSLACDVLMKLYCYDRTNLSILYHSHSYAKVSVTFPILSTLTNVVNGTVSSMH